MIALIVNADDLGINPQRDRGIFEAFRDGIVTSTSLLANGPSFETAVEQIKATGIPVGVHLTLSDGPALTGTVAGLTDSKGKLPGKQWLRQQLVVGDCNFEAIRAEFSSQIEKVLHNGIQPDHLDGHQHCQVFPPLPAMVVDLCKEYGIGAMRSSCPAEENTRRTDELLDEEMALYRKFGKDAHAKICASGIRTTQGLWGAPLLHSLDTNSLCRLLEDLSTGFWELMTHPGYPYPQGRPFENPQRWIELQALLSPEAREVVTRRGIRLCTFGDLPCAP